MKRIYLPYFYPPIISTIFFFLESPLQYNFKYSFISNKEINLSALMKIGEISNGSR